MSMPSINDLVYCLHCGSKDLFGHKMQIEYEKVMEGGSLEVEQVPKWVDVSLSCNDCGKGSKFRIHVAPIPDQP